MLGYRVDLYFGEYGHSDRNIDYGIKRQKAIERDVGQRILLCF